MKIKAFAKVNLFLDTVGVRSDGYHEIVSVMQSVSLCDVITVTPAPGLTLTCSDPTLSGEGNLGHKAAKLFFECAKVNGGADIYIEKHIPVSGGLGGGSADAAAVLKALNAMYGDALSEQELHDAALALGADVPFCLTGGTAQAEGIGERLTPLANLPGCYFVIAVKGVKSSTGDMYRALDAQPVTEHPDIGVMQAGILSGDLKTVCDGYYNCFERVCGAPLKEARSLMRGLCCGLSGSGPSIFGIFGDAMSAECAAERLSRAGFEGYTCTPETAGNRIF